MNPSDNQGRNVVYSDTKVRAVAAVPTVNADPDSDEQVLIIAKRNFGRFTGAEAKWRERAKQELDFLALKHWRDADKQRRGDAPALTFDLIGPTIDTIINKARQNPPAPSVVPVGEGSDKDTAQIIEGLYRNVNADSDGDVATMIAYEHIVKIGRGAVRWEYDYEPGDTFQQKLVIKPVFDPFSVYPDPSCDLRSLHYANNRLRECYEVELLTREAFEARFGKKRSDGDADRPTMSFAYADIAPAIDGPFWNREGVVVLTRWWVATETSELYQLKNGDIMTGDQLPTDEAGVPDKSQVLNKRVKETRTVKYARFTGWEVLERGDWPGEWIPIAFGVGGSYFDDNCWNYRGVVRPAMEPNLAYDVMRSRLVEKIGYEALTQTIAPIAAVENFQDYWKDFNRVAMPFIPYNHADANGNPIPAPQRFSNAADIGGMVTACQMAKDDVKAVLNSWDDPTMGGPAEGSASGRALAIRAAGSDNSHFHFFDSLLRMIRQSGRIFVDLVPHIYSEERVININDPDGSLRQVKVNAEHIDRGVKRFFDLAKSGGVLRYDVVIDTAGSYASRVDKQKEMIQQYYQTNPQAAVLTGDLFFKMLNIPMSDEFAARLRPPGAPPDMDGLPPEATAMIQQAQQQIQQLNAALQQATDENTRHAADLSLKKYLGELNAAVTLASKESDATTQTLAPVIDAVVGAHLAQVMPPPPPPQPAQIAAPTTQE